MSENIKMLFIGFIAGSLVCGLLWGIGYCTNKVRIDSELQQYRATLASYETAYKQTERAYQEARTAADNARIQYDRLRESISGMGVEVGEVGQGQSDIEREDQQLNEAIKRHGEILERLSD